MPRRLIEFFKLWTPVTVVWWIMGSVLLSHTWIWIFPIVVIWIVFTLICADRLTRARDWKILMKILHGHYTENDNQPGQEPIVPLGQANHGRILLPME